jgi:hypothetical protein
MTPFLSDIRFQIAIVITITALMVWRELKKLKRKGHE